MVYDPRSLVPGMGDFVSILVLAYIYIYARIRLHSPAGAVRPLETFVRCGLWQARAHVSANPSLSMLRSKRKAQIAAAKGDKQEKRRLHDHDRADAWETMNDSHIK